MKKNNCSPILYITVMQTLTTALGKIRFYDTFEILPDNSKTAVVIEAMILTYY